MPEPVGPQVDRVKAKLDRRAAELLSQLASDVFGRLVDGTPVDTPEYTDTPGVLRGNWNFGVGIDDPTFSEARANPAGPPPETPAVAVGDTVFLTNHTPYAEVVEYGGYPVPVMRGSWNRVTKSYVIKSAGGFSQKAPSGWVRLIAAQVPALARQWADRIRGQ